MDDLENICLQVEKKLQDNPFQFLGNSFVSKHTKILMMDLLMNFSRLEVNLKRLITYAEIKTQKEEVKTFSLAQIIKNQDILECFDDEIKKSLKIIESNMVVRNSIAHAIPNVLNETYILFFSHDISEIKKIKAEINDPNYKYYRTQRTKDLLKKKVGIDESNYCLMRIKDLINLNKILTDVCGKVEMIVNTI